ncbi:MAG: aldo/keto reductase [Clostridia bacterium]|nr:aldo/keto reductase [Clostridia bacterium]NCC44309.1 aldo/keto reductase [Clostridia bacterium]
MKKRILGKDLEVSAIGLGTMGFTHAYGTAMDEKEAEKAIQAAAHMGYTFFDTAECYIGEREDGTTAYNEDLVGAALQEVRHEIKIASKFGVHHNQEGKLVMDSRPEIIRKSIEGSLTKLKTDYLDLYYQHRIDPKIPAEEVAGVMSELMQEGKILHWGISETTEEYLRKAHAVCPVTCIENRYSMMARWYENMFPVLEELNIGYVAFQNISL